MKKLLTVVFLPCLLAWVCLLTGFFIGRNNVSKMVSQDRLWSLVQDWRKGNNLPTYTKNQTLCDVAAIRLQDLYEENSHKRFKERVNTYLYGYISENLADGWENERDVLDAWLNSPSHKAALEDDYTDGCIVSDGDYVVHLFGKF
jgi:uncharacterized protein YkwD